MVNHFQGENPEIKTTLPLLPVRDLVVYPFMILPLFVGRKSSIKAVEESLKNCDRQIVLASQMKVHQETPSPDDIFKMGTVGLIMRMRKLADGRLKILVQGIQKVNIMAFCENKNFYQVNLDVIEAPKVKKQIQHEILMKAVREKLEKVVSLGKNISSDILMVLEDIHDPGRLSDLIASNLNLRVEQAQKVLEIHHPIERLEFIETILDKELEFLNVQHKLKGSKTLNSEQKEFFLKEQIKAIRSELNDDQNNEKDELAELRDKMVAMDLPEEVSKEAMKQLTRLERMHPDSSESNVIRTYLEWITDLPWNTSSDEVTDLVYAQQVLDEDHFELAQAKTRILEQLAVRSLKQGTVRGPILCFSGPPGVGKTSLGKSIAKATGREFIRISLGGVRDESEMRGHRRTYVGSMPGRFIQAIKQAGTNNPIIMLDEIDKLGSDYKGDPSSALLEILDPEQNCEFRDHYLNLPFDLSNVMFIATANVLENIPGPLRDRMEVINLSGYTREDKVAISQKYLVPRQIDQTGISDEHIKFTQAGLETVVAGYTREAGLRNLERLIGSVCRKVAHKVASGDSELVTVTPKKVQELLGPVRFMAEDGKEYDEVGVATGLAWTAAGGEILYIESTTMKGKGITLTGQLGDVMKESAQAALGHIRSKAVEFGINEDIFNEKEIHIHLPAGAIPKDGPSAGITLATTIVSVLTNTRICKDIAMTGEITLTGKVLPVGGIKEKALAAMRMGIETIIIPWKNQKDLADIPEKFLKKLNFIPVKNFTEVLEIALVDWEPSKYNTDQVLEEKIAA